MMYTFKFNKVASTVALYCAIASLNGCATFDKKGAEQANNQSNPPTLFTETSGVIPVEDRGRRKWDVAIVGDLDGNGYQDLLLTEHAHKVFVYWNEGGTFTEPSTLINGDMHGTAIADFDKDGLVEVIIAQGGGNGSNPRKPKHFEITKDRQFTGGKPLEHFEKGRGRSVKVFDANNDGNSDLFLTGFATPEQFETGANHFYSNSGTGEFVFEGNLPFSDRLSYRSVITDFNGDDQSDILVFGGKRMVAIAGGEGYTFSDVTDKVLGSLKHTSDVSAISQLDFDGDGDLDLAISRAEHQFEPETYYDAASKRFAFFSRFQPLQLEDLTIDGDFVLENLQMAYPDFDVYVGKDKRLLDFKSSSKDTSHDLDRSGTINLTASESFGWPEDLCVKGVKMKNLPKDSKPGLYIGYMGNNHWRICSQTSSATAGVINNVISTPATTKDESLPAMLLENRDGQFFDVTSKMGIDINEQTTSALAADYDNDGWTDLFFMRYGDMSKEVTQYLYMNNQGKSFTLVDNHGAISTDLGATGAGAEVIDYDKDGDFDLIFANERGKWHLFENHNEILSNNNYIGITVGMSPVEKADLFGTKVTINACGRTQVREVGNTSSSFAVTYNNDLLFGLGQCDEVDTVTVTWTNGEEIQLNPKQVNQYININ
ncbi:CRTAC1 family protein [Colwellia sp. 1_MG-2023]|uniref:CRTAC1 family protein n=1 Tax=unclassified Colwellia TaxID=196834 RepID=UPI001C085BCE|nr:MULTISPECIES: CRTAC1 family protein [unclassified Colwellia]MBU2924263.1 CRTAC1 family protein [Colwellia sp. C2M11]MDO6652972.1 CRTAC1 family protein [Colwellia sp. 3_MG-2023]MDO6665454.1 CRTAC1 family protein [Colwellia sp. 2_MG-2023]MDO6689787.1 CRTAC1 family protein [Colwellia sp. 1_MG-2023]